jgi:hypothetical protein
MSDKYNSSGKALEIKKYLLSGKTLTQRQAIDMFNVYRLAVIIDRMRKDGHNIITERRVPLNPLTGEPFFVYYLAKVVVTEARNK